MVIIISLVMENESALGKMVVTKGDKQNAFY